MRITNRTVKSVLLSVVYCVFLHLIIQSFSYKSEIQTKTEDSSIIRSSEFKPTESLNPNLNQHQTTEETQIQDDTKICLHDKECLSIGKFCIDHKCQSLTLPPPPLKSDEPSQSLFTTAEVTGDDDYNDDSIQTQSNPDNGYASSLIQLLNITTLNLGQEKPEENHAAFVNSTDDYYINNSLNYSNDDQEDQNARRHISESSHSYLPIYSKPNIHKQSRSLSNDFDNSYGSVVSTAFSKAKEILSQSFEFNFPRFEDKAGKAEIAATKISGPHEEQVQRKLQENSTNLEGSTASGQLSGPVVNWNSTANGERRGPTQSKCRVDLDCLNRFGKCENGTCRGSNKNKS